MVETNLPRRRRENGRMALLVRSIALLRVSASLQQIQFAAWSMLTASGRRRVFGFFDTLTLRQRQRAGANITSELECGIGKGTVPVAGNRTGPVFICGLHIDGSPVEADTEPEMLKGLML